LNKTKILLADDDAAVRQMLNDLLTPQGFMLDEAEDGAEVIEKLQNKAYDLVLLDLNMPNTSGMDVLKFISGRGLGCRVIVLTGMADIAVAIDSIKHGADDYIAKPCRGGDLVSSINKVLAK
jgi:DNA-binding NtrC family response regulator